MSVDKRAISVTELINTKFRIMHFEGSWKRTLGSPELSGSWIVYGPPKNGKTRFVLQLCKYLTQFARVGYNSLEEGVSESLMKAFKEVGMEEVKCGIVLYDKESITVLKERLRKQKSPKVVVIDSLQYSGLSYPDYKKLKDEFRDKLFIFISHADGKEPMGRTARAVKYDANIIIHVQGFKASANGRYGGGEPYTIWEEGALKYHG